MLQHGFLRTICIRSANWLLILNGFTCSQIYGEWQVLGTGKGENESLVWTEFQFGKWERSGDRCEWSHARSFTLNVVKVQHKPHAPHW